MMDLTDHLNWYDLYRRKTDLTSTTHDIWGAPIESPYYGKTTLKDGRETTYKRGHSFKSYVGKWLMNDKMAGF